MSEPAQEPLASVPDPEPDPKAERQGTVYLVLTQSAENGPWTVVGNYTAASANAAKSAAIKDKDFKAGTFVAVPARSWTPSTVSVETQTKIKLT